ncbi:DUF1295 domain-containing protein [Candidatus Peribacteria bacterium]|nr:DUF1295 domain-containing protein [Candidatus Peribacteria bacterium]
MIPLICILFWSVRLFAHIIQRLKHHPEDTRYAHFRTLWGENFRWKSYTYIFLLQGLFIAIIALPFWILFHPEFRLSIAFFIGLFGWIL